MAVSDVRCKSCFLRTYENLFDKFGIYTSHFEEFLKEFHAFYEREADMSSPEIQRLLSKIFVKLTGIADPFEQEKHHSNLLALELYRKWQPIVAQSIDSIDVAIRLSIAGNIMDYGASLSFEVDSTIDTVLKSEYAVDHSQYLRNKIANAKQILFLGDNAGEIVFDRLLIETMGHKNVVYAVKGAPILNDVTIQDALLCNMSDVAKVIDNGYDAPSTIVEQCSDEFKRYFNSADLIISKGQGNLEGLVDLNDPRIFFLLMVKCDVIAEIVHVPTRSFVVYCSNLSAEN